MKRPELDLFQAEGVTDDEEEESEVEDHWMSEEMSLSEGEPREDKPKRYRRNLFFFF